jgi:GNAT superfamily N-acetyltransferase
MIFVDDKYRKRGVAGKLIEELKKDADHIGITKASFSCPDMLAKNFAKHGAEITRVMMRGKL